MKAAILRSKQRLLEKFGAAEETIDPEFNARKRRFIGMESRLAKVRKSAQAYANSLESIEYYSECLTQDLTTFYLLETLTPETARSMQAPPNTLTEKAGRGAGRLASGAKSKIVSFKNKRKAAPPPTEKEQKPQDPKKPRQPEGRIGRKRMEIKAKKTPAVSQFCTKRDKEAQSASQSIQTTISSFQESTKLTNKMFEEIRKSLTFECCRDLHMLINDPELPFKQFHARFSSRNNVRVEYDAARYKLKKAKGKDIPDPVKVREAEKEYKTKKSIYMTTNEDLMEDLNLAWNDRYSWYDQYVCMMIKQDMKMLATIKSSIQLIKVPESTPVHPTYTETDTNNDIDEIDI